MLFQSIWSAATLSLPLVSATISPMFHEDAKWKRAKSVYYPEGAEDVKTITTPTGVKIRYKEPGKEGVCETTPGVGSYSGFVDLVRTSLHCLLSTGLELTLSRLPTSTSSSGSSKAAPTQPTTLFLCG